MRIVIVVVGKRTEHWEGFFAALADRPELELVIHAADVSRRASERLEELARRNPRVRFRLAPHLLGEELTGHMASIMFRPGSWRPLMTAVPDILHVIGEAAYLATNQAIRFRDRVWPHVPVTLFAAQNVLTRFPWPFPRLERYAYERTALALPITPAAREVLRAKGYRGRAEIVPLGVDLGRFRPRSSPPPEPFTVAFVGRLEKHKGVADLVAASDLLGCRLLVVGDGSLRPWLEGEAAKRPAGRIEIVPWLDHDELPSRLHRAHALALPSVEIVQRNVVPWVGVPLREQFGRVLVEAMACGVPVVASSVGEIPEVIGSSGLTFPPGDLSALARALADIRDRPGLAGALARSGVERAAQFSWTRIATQVYEEWSKLAPARRSDDFRRAA